MEFPVLPEPSPEPARLPIGDPADPQRPRPKLTVVYGGGVSTSLRAVLHIVPPSPADRT
jgi:hypothetical protein